MKHHRNLNNVPPVPVLSQLNPDYSLTFYAPTINSNTVSELKSSLGFPPNTVHLPVHVRCP
jgi:hypothetical protein